jgi:hypothetical protein
MERGKEQKNKPSYFWGRNKTRADLKTLASGRTLNSQSEI